MFEFTSKIRQKVAGYEDINDDKRPVKTETEKKTGKVASSGFPNYGTFTTLSTRHIVVKS